MSEKSRKPDELKELMNPDNWELTEDERQSTAAPPRPPRAIISVAFQRADFEKVERFALEQGQRISEVVRNATMAYVGGAMVVGSGIRMVTAGGKEIQSDVPSLHPTTALSPNWELDRVDRTA